MKPIKELILSTSVLFSLYSSAQVRIAVKGGVNYSTAKVTVAGIKQANGYITGANIGLQLTREFDGPLHFSPYIGYSNRGFIIKRNDTTRKNSIHYIDIGAILSFHIPAGNNK